MSTTQRTAALVRSAHPGPTVAVTLLATAYGVSVGLAPGRVALVASAVLAGQLSIGWTNDLVDASRDRAVGRHDKPVATGEARGATVGAACAAAVVATVVLSLACGWVAGLVHLGCVACGWAYDLGVKATVWSWLPYVLAFGGLPVFIGLADPGGGAPPWWIPSGAALLGAGAHLLNALPDLADDVATGVRGLPQRIGARTSASLAVAVLVAGTAVIVTGTAVDGRPVPAALLAVVSALVAAMAVLALVGRGRVPFRAAIGIAVADVVLLVASM